MTGGLSRTLAIAFGLGLAAGAVAAEDLTIVSTVTGGKTALTQTQYLTATKSRSQTGDQDNIVDYQTGAIVSINHKKKEYYETSFDEMAAAFRKLGDEAAQLPAFLQKKMGGAVEAVTVTPGTASRTIAGYDCREYKLAMGKDMEFEIWAAAALQPPARYVDALKAPYAAMGPVGRRFEAMFDEMKKIKGFPLAFATHYKILGKHVDTLSEATEVRKGPIEGSVFAVPAGYKKKDSPFRQK